MRLNRLKTAIDATVGTSESLVKEWTTLTKIGVSLVARNANFWACSLVWGRMGIRCLALQILMSNRGLNLAEEA